MQPLAIECLAEAPSCIDAAKRLESDGLFFICPFSVLWCRGCGLDTPKGRACGRGVVCSQQGGLDTLEEDLVVNARLCAAAEGDNGIHEIGVLGRPLEALAATHRPAGYTPEMGDAELLSEEGVLGADVVIEGYVWERGDGGVGWRDGLAVAEEGSDDDEGVCPTLKVHHHEEIHQHRSEY